VATGREETKVGESLVGGDEKRPFGAHAPTARRPSDRPSLG
jgi:hypothetical protein